MTHYSFRLVQLRAEQQLPTLVLQTEHEAAELHIRVCPSDAQQIALALAGLATPVTRLAQLVQRLAEQLDARPSHLLLERTAGSLVEASLVLATALEQVTVPLAFGDAVVLAQVNKLPLRGDASVASLLRVAAPEPDPEPVAPLPAPFAAFFDALSTGEA